MSNTNGKPLFKVGYMVTVKRVFESLGITDPDEEIIDLVFTKNPDAKDKIFYSHINHEELKKVFNENNFLGLYKEYQKEKESKGQHKEVLARMRGLLPFSNEPAEDSA